MLAFASLVTLHQRGHGCKCRHQCRCIIYIGRTSLNRITGDTCQIHRAGHGLPDTVKSALSAVRSRITKTSLGHQNNFRATPGHCFPVQTEALESHGWQISYDNICGID